MEKTDKIDASVMAAFAAVKGLKPMPPPDEKQRRLKALATRLRQVTQDISMNKQRRSQCFDAESRTSIDAVVALLKRQAKTLGKNPGGRDRFPHQRRSALVQTR